MGREHLMIDVYVNRRDRAYRDLKEFLSELELPVRYHESGATPVRKIFRTLRRDGHRNHLRTYVRRGNPDRAWRMQAAYFGFTPDMRQGMRDLKASISHPFFSG